MHSKHAFKWLTILTLIAVTLSAALLCITTTTQGAIDPQDKAASLFTLLEKANVTVTEVFCQLEAKNVVVPQTSLEQYNQALILADEAQNLIHASNYSEANNKIIQTLQKFKEALRIVYTTIPDQTTETESALEKTVQLKSSINRYSEQLQRIENLTRFAAAVGYNATVIETKIQTIKALIDMASNNIDQKHFEAALNNLAETKTLIDSLVKAINEVAVNLKIQRLQTYITQTEVRLATIKETAISLSNIGSLTALNNAETSLENAKEYLENQQITETLSELANSRASEEEAVEYLKTAALSSDATSSTSSNAVRSP